jgi:hypothetical protein
LPKQQYTPFLALPRPHTSSFLFSLCSELMLRIIFNLIRFGLAPTHSATLHSHLASAYAFLFTHFVQTTRLAPQTTRLRLKHLNKPRLRTPFAALKDSFVRGFPRARCECCLFFLLVTQSGSLSNYSGPKLLEDPF